MMAEFLAKDFVEARERFVQQHDRGFGSECPGEGDPLLLPTGQLVRVAPTEAWEVHELEHLVALVHLHVPARDLLLQRLIGTEEELLWKANYRRWMAFVNDYKNRGGRVTVGSDSGYIYKTYGFGTIEELEMLREAGFHPLEVMRAATLSGAEALRADDRIGSIEPGKLADLVVLSENPLANLKVLYGTGHIRLGADGEPARVGGVRYTIKDGIVYDAAALLADVRRIVAAEKARRGIERLPQPGR